MGDSFTNFILVTLIALIGLNKLDVFGNFYNNSVTTPTWSSKVLIANGSVQLPIPNGPVQYFKFLGTIKNK